MTAKRAANRLSVNLPNSAALRRLVPLVVAVALFLFGLFAFWQGWLVYSDRSAAEAVPAVQKRAASAVQAELATLRKQVAKALTDAQIKAALTTGDAVGRASAARRLSQILPSVGHAEFFTADLGEVVNADYSRFGYAKAAQLMAAKNDRAESGFEAAMQGGKNVLTIAAPVQVAGAPAGYVWLTMPFASVQRRFEAIHPGRARLELRQQGNAASVTLLSTGANLHGDDASVIPVAGSHFAVAALVPHSELILPRSMPVALAVGLLSLLAAVALLWQARRRHQVPAFEDAEPTLSELSQQADAASTAAAPVKTEAAAAAPPEAVSVDRHIFRAYDIRGVVGQSLDATVTRLIGQAIGSVMIAKGLHEIVVGRDGRLSGPELAGALAEGLRASGVDVIDIGAVPTPVVYFASYRFNTGCGVAVTGSHNPPDYNGFKIVIAGETLSEGAIQELYERIAEGRLESGGQGDLRRVDVVPDYIERIASDVQTDRQLKVVADAGNGIAGGIVPQLLEAIGCDVVPLYCEVDGTFPNHHPDPSDPQNLDDLILAVKKTGADLGLAFDGDGDRLGVVTPSGEVIYPDRLLMLFARDVLLRQPGATIIYDVKCTGHLQSEILHAGGSPLMWRTGHSLIKAKMRETDAALAGEMSGHFFFGERWYGFDDGLYAAARLLEIIAGDLDGRDAEAIFSTLPNGVSTPELKIEMEEGEHYAFIEAFREKASFEGARLTTIDGVRADWRDGWGLVRASNTTPVLVLRFDADDAEALKRIQDAFRTQIHAVNPELKLPF